jgi:hypothetical protein
MADTARSLNFLNMAETARCLNEQHGYLCGNLNCKHGGILKMAVYLNFKSGGIFEYGGKFKMTEITRWRYFKYGSCARSLNMTKVRHFIERGGRVVR